MTVASFLTRIAVILAFVATTAFIFVPYNFVHTSPVDAVEGFERNTLYALFDPKRGKRGSSISASICSGDVIKYRSKRQKYSFYRVVAAKEGSSFQLNDAGYEIDGNSTEMSSDWLQKAKAEWSEIPSATSLNKYEFLIINTEFGKEGKKNNWAFDVIKSSQVNYVADLILFSRDVSAIGKRVKVDHC